MIRSTTPVTTTAGRTTSIHKRVDKTAIAIDDDLNWDISSIPTTPTAPFSIPSSNNNHSQVTLHIPPPLPFPLPLPLSRPTPTSQTVPQHTAQLKPVIQRRRMPRHGMGGLSHLSTDEVKRIRRVRNRESVEKCRTKQRLRMEALQVEQTCLLSENELLSESIRKIESLLFVYNSNMKKKNKTLN